MLVTALLSSTFIPRALKESKSMVRSSFVVHLSFENSPGSEFPHANLNFTPLVTPVSSFPPTELGRIPGAAHCDAGQDPWQPPIRSMPQFPLFWGGCSRSGSYCQAWKWDERGSISTTALRWTLHPATASSLERSCPASHSNPNTPSASAGVVSKRVFVLQKSPLDPG